VKPATALIGRIVVAAMVSLVGSASALAATFVYVSNAEDGDISTFRLQDSGELQAGARVKAAGMVMPMAVTPDRRFLYAASRAKPFTVFAYAIHPGTGALTQLSSSPAAESFPYISLDRTGRFLLGASYGGNLVSVNAVGSDGRVAAEPLQVIPVGRNAHSIRVDESNRFAFAPSLGSDQIFMFTFDAKSGQLRSNTPSTHLMKIGTGPRHFVTSGDNRFLYALTEMTGMVTTFALDGNSGLLKEVSVASGLPPDTNLTPGEVRLPPAPNMRPRNREKDIWASDLHLSPNGKFMFVSERTNDTLTTLGVDGATGTLTFLSSTKTERQPRGFAVDPKGRFLVAAGEMSETLSVYAIDPANGSLKLVNKAPAGKGANWVEIVNFD
jgi:6-phosphogluconolactonase